MKYFISFKNPLTHFFNVRLELECQGQDHVLLKLPIWRPGRYEAANYAKNVRGFSIKNNDGEGIDYTKINHSTWKVDTKQVDSLVVNYDYWAFKMDAGNSWYDEDQVYINFINCMVYDAERLDEACTVNIDLPDDYSIACGLTKHGKQLSARDYYELVDSPLMAAANLRHYTYVVQGYSFHIWLNGAFNTDAEKLVSDFEKFTRTQIEALEEFPEREYHFLLQILPYKFYHGVEHHGSTVICLGPGQALDTDEMYSQLMGVSSHELFHAWNIIKIRPSEMLPYQFDREVTFPTGFVAEGFTTYYGDLFLVRSGVFDRSWYFNELNTLFRRHFSNFGRLNYSVVDSSIDLWIDGYALTTPDRKSSIYVEGAIIALSLDLMIRKRSNNERSLDDVIRKLWVEYGKKGIGYNYDGVKNICEEIYGDHLTEFFNDHVKGTAPKNALLNDLLAFVGCQLMERESENDLEKYFGIRVSEPNGALKITQIAPGSIGERYFSLNDEILSINNQPLEVDNINQFTADGYKFNLRRNYKDREITLHPGTESFFNQYVIEPVPSPSESQLEAFRKWTGCELLSLLAKA